MSLRINSEAPDFTAETTQGTISFHNWIGSSWAILFSHPKDFTPVCTTELGYMAALKPHFDQRNTKIIGLSVDPVANHGRWAKDIEETQGHYDDAIRDTFIAQKRQYHIRRTDDQDFLTQAGGRLVVRQEGPARAGAHHRLRRHGLIIETKGTET